MTKLEDHLICFVLILLKVILQNNLFQKNVFRTLNEFLSCLIKQQIEIILMNKISEFYKESTNNEL